MSKLDIQFDLKATGAQLLTQLEGIVADVTDPKFQAVVQSLMQDAADIGVLKARGADPLLVAEAERDWEAGLASAAATPGLIAAEKVPSFIGILSNIGSVVIATAFSVARAYLGLPVIPPATGS